MHLRRHVGSVRTGLILFVTVGLLVGPLAQAPAAGQGGEGPTVEHTVLPSGMVVVTERRPESRVAALVVAVRAGSRFEDERTDSAAHMLEHMYYQGTPSRPSAAELARPIQALGGWLGTGAGMETLRFEASVPAASLDVAIEVVSDMLLNSSFEEDKLAKERRIVLQELADVEDSPASLVTQTLRREIFAGQATSRLESGSAEGVRRLAQADMLAFRDRWIGANRTVVAVVGPHDHADVVARIGRALADFRVAEAPPMPAVDLARARVGRLDVEAGAEQAQVAVGVPVAGWNSPDRYPLAVMQASLNGFTGRLISEIREQRGLAYRTSASTSLLSDVGIFWVEAGTDPENAEEVLALLEAELARLRQQPLSADELSRAIGLASGSLLVDSEIAAARATDLALKWSVGATESLEEFQAGLAAVTAEDVQRVAWAYFGPERQLRVVVQP